MTAARDRRLTSTLEHWFGANARDLPWRQSPPGERDPYHVLVSEAMLQQTQIARVVDRFDDFLAEFPTIEALAAADEQTVLAQWAGLGYYRRARNLHAAARAIVEEHAGTTPRDVATLQELPGVGRYTAGAIASMAFGQRAPIVDANVRRVLMRVENQPDANDAWSWDRAAALVERAGDPAAFNEALMELGSTTCLPRGPRCSDCPWQRSCRARRAGTAGDIPRPKAAKPKKEIVHAAVLVRDDEGRTLVQQRPDSGMWAGMWQAPTIEAPDPPGPGRIRSWLGVRSVRQGERFSHATTHRMVHFHVWHAEPGSDAPLVGSWADADRLAALPLATPHRRILLGTHAN
ncbi:MAG: A/G-specific adenine glycosylase [Planctomycetota bacterium]